MSCVHVVPACRVAAVWCGQVRMYGISKCVVRSRPTYHLPHGPDAGATCAIPHTAHRSPDLRMQGEPGSVYLPMEVGEMEKFLQVVGVAHRVDGEAVDGLDSAAGPGED